MNGMVGSSMGDGGLRLGAVNADRSCHYCVEIGHVEHAFLGQCGSRSFDKLRTNGVLGLVLRQAQDERGLGAVLRPVRVPDSGSELPHPMIRAAHPTDVAVVVDTGPRAFRAAWKMQRGFCGASI